MKTLTQIPCLLLAALLVSPAWGESRDMLPPGAEEQETIIEDDAAVLIEEDGITTAIEIEDDAEAGEADEVILEEDGAVIEEVFPGGEPVDYEDDAQLADAGREPRAKSGLSAGIDEAWAEAGYVTDPNAAANTSDYLHVAFSARWDSGGTWEARLAGRVDGYYQSGSQSPGRTQLDYGESFIRYRGGDFRITAGTQTIIWGRIDELPPTDRLSVFDLSRFILDDLADRRRAQPAVRLEYFNDAGKLDLVWLPDFREARLPGRSSIWFPVDRQKGELLGLESTPASRALVKAGTFTEHAPDGDGGFGARYSHTASQFDYALTIQRVRQSTPYYEMVSPGRYKARYPRSWVMGGDLGYEALGATWRLEGAYLSEIPVTKKDATYTTTEGIGWAAGVEFYPGDGDVRVNLQLVGNNLIDAPGIRDRKETYNFNGEVESQFAHNRWRAKTRFFVGLDKKDIYLNPEVAYIGWEPHEIYLGAHYFDGANGTLGGFHEDHSLLTLGWRAKF